MSNDYPTDIQSTDDVPDKTIGVWNVGDELDIRYWLKTIHVPLDFAVAAA